MIYKYKFWHSLFHPSQFALALDEDYQLKGYRLRYWILFLLTVALFLGRDLWGMGTENLTTLYASNINDEFIFSRMMSAIGAACWGILFFLFQYIVVSFILSILTDFSFRAIAKVQLFVIAILFIEKLVLWIVFAIAGFTTEFSLFSFAPIISTFTEDRFFLHLIDHLSAGVIISIAVQYIFLSKWEAESKFTLLAKIIVLQLFFALIIAGMSIMPINEWIVRVVGL